MWGVFAEAGAVIRGVSDVIAPAAVLLIALVPAQ